MTDSPLEARLRALGEERYHHRHPFHLLLHSGKLNQTQVQAWALNRFEYQRIIPQKDAAILARLTDPADRREWRHRLEDQDGTESAPGGVEKWLRLTDGLGLDRAQVLAGRGVLPGTRFAAQAYLTFVKERSVLEAVASSLTELFAPKLVEHRLTAMLAHYDFVSKDSMAYFSARLDQAPRDASWALRYVVCQADTAEKQDAVVAALAFKCDVLWAQLDALHYGYVEPALLPPWAFGTGPR
jgi:pyrroloquinoline-quinone synthase